MHDSPASAAGALSSGSASGGKPRARCPYSSGRHVPKWCHLDLVEAGGWAQPLLDPGWAAQCSHAAVVIAAAGLGM